MDEQPDQDAPVTGHCPSEELISWHLTQKYFFDQSFGGAIINGRRNIFASTLDLTGVAFLTEKRAISPIISRMRLRSSPTPTSSGISISTPPRSSSTPPTSSSISTRSNLFGALSYARLDAPGRFFTENPTPTTGVSSSNGVTSAISDFNQLRVLVGYGNPTKPGLSIAANSGNRPKGSLRSHQLADHHLRRRHHHLVQHRLPRAAAIRHRAGKL